MSAAESSWIPRSGYDEVEGYVWLPRLLDKARRSREGDLGDYMVFGGSPMDGFAMAHFRCTEAQLLGWIDAGLSDGAIALAIAEALGEDLAARKAWSARFKLMYGLFLSGMDADEGRMPPGLPATLLKGLVTLTTAVVRLTPGH